MRISTSTSDQRQVHFRAPIRTSEGIRVNMGTWAGTTATIFTREYIDLNNDEVPNSRRVGDTFHRVQVQVDEPDFTQGYDSIKKLAQSLQKDVITEDDVRRIDVSNEYYDLGRYISSGPNFSESRNKRTIEELIDEVGTFPKDVKWAIDVAKSEFFIYS